MGRRVGAGTGAPALTLDALTVGAVGLAAVLTLLADAVASCRSEVSS